MSLPRVSARVAAVVTAVAAVAVLVSGPTPPAAAQPGPLPGPAPVPEPVHTPGAAPGPRPAPGPASASASVPGSPSATASAPGPATATTTAPGRASASISACPDIEVIFARGTDDTPGLGTPGTAFVNALRSQVGGRRVTSYAVNYPASYDFLAAADGATDATNRVSTLAQQCPETRIVLGGYSQGAAVMDMLAGVPPLGNKIGDLGSAPPLPASLVPNIAAVAVFGNPATKFSNPITKSVFGGRAIDLCKDGDPICSDGRNPFAHNDYVSAGLIQQAANFVAGRV